MDHASPNPAAGGLESNRSNFQGSAHLAAMSGDVDLESRLQQAWMRSQLEASANSKKKESALVPQRISRDLTETLEGLWNRTQQQQQEQHVQNHQSLLFRDVAGPAFQPRRPTSFSQAILAPGQGPRATIPRDGSLSAPASGRFSPGSGKAGSAPRATTSPTSSASSSISPHRSTSWEVSPPVSSAFLPLVSASASRSFETPVATHSSAPSPPSTSPSHHTATPSHPITSPSHASASSTIRPVASSPSLRSAEGGGPQSSDEDLRLDDLSLDEWLARLQKAQPVQLGAEYMEEDFQRGMDELGSAFQEMEQLLPEQLALPFQPHGAWGVFASLDPGVVTAGGAAATAGPVHLGSSLGQRIGGAEGSGGGRWGEEALNGPTAMATDMEELQQLVAALTSRQGGGGGGQGAVLGSGAGTVDPGQVGEGRAGARNEVLSASAAAAPAYFACPFPQGAKLDPRSELVADSGGYGGGDEGPIDSRSAGPAREIAAGHEPARPGPPPLPPASSAINALIQIARHIVAGDRASVHAQLSQLTEVASVYGNASQRLSAYFLEGLMAKVTGTLVVDNTCDSVNHRSVDCGAPLLRAFEVLVSSSPYLTFGHVAANSSILEAVQSATAVHVVDFGIGHGVQWPALIQALAVRPGGPPHLRITGIDRPYVAGIQKGYCLRQTGERLRAVAEAWGVPFAYHVLPVHLPDLQVDMVRQHSGETLLVNCSLRLHNLMDETVTPSNPRGAVLRTMRALNPSLCTLVEQHTNHNSPFFLSRFLEALHYYAGLFEALDESVPAGSARERRMFEQHVLGRAIVNVVAAEGQERTERQEPQGQWENRMQRAGFMPAGLSGNVRATVEALLTTYKEGYSIMSEKENSLILNWRNKPLLAMSAWSPI